MEVVVAVLSASGCCGASCGSVGSGLGSGGVVWCRLVDSDTYRRALTSRPARRRGTPGSLVSSPGYRVRCGAVWCGAVWCGVRVVKHGAVWCSMVQCSVMVCSIRIFFVTWCETAFSDHQKAVYDTPNDMMYKRSR